MQLLPESITTSKTAALDTAWAQRLALLRYTQLKVDFSTEINAQKLVMWLEMFGISPEALEQDLTADEYRRLLQNVILIFKLSGSIRSVELLCTVLGATSAKVRFTYVTRHDTRIGYNGLYRYDKGAQYQQFAVSVDVAGVVDLAAFEAKLKRLFAVFEPMWIYLERVYSSVADLKIKVMLEGAIRSNLLMTTGLTNYLPEQQPYGGIPWNYEGTEQVAGIPAGVVDWLLIELRRAKSALEATNQTTFARRAGFVLTDGRVVDLDGSSALRFPEVVLGDGEKLYVVVRHRNHLPIMSASEAVLTTEGYVYDFTTSVEAALGGSYGYKLKYGVPVMVAGDSDRDGNIFVSDYNGWASGFGLTKGYYSWDFDFDSNIFVSDYNYWAINFGVIAFNRTVYFTYAPAGNLGEVLTLEESNTKISF